MVGLVLQFDLNSLSFKTIDELEISECIVGKDHSLKAIKLYFFKK